MKENFKDLIKKATETAVSSPIQKVVPLKKEKKEETIFSFYIPTDKLKKLKIISVEKDISIKELINSAIDKEYFK
jgi:hypothetical protein